MQRPYYLLKPELSIRIQKLFALLWLSLNVHLDQWVDCKSKWFHDSCNILLLTKTYDLVEEKLLRSWINAVLQAGLDFLKHSAIKFIWVPKGDARLDCIVQQNCFVWSQLQFHNKPVQSDETHKTHVILRQLGVLRVPVMHNFFITVALRVSTDRRVCWEVLLQLNFWVSDSWRDMGDLTVVWLFLFELFQFLTSERF